jgi:hypothetical protein
MEEKRLYDISWQVTEEKYRLDPALSYSTLAKYDREGFNKLDSLFDRVESPSLTFGSAVDALITGSREEFDDLFMVADLPEVKDSVLNVTKIAYSRYADTCPTLYDIPNKDLSDITEELQFQLNWKPETRAKVVREQGNDWYVLMFASNGRQILTNDTANKVFSAVRALKESPATSFYFAKDNPFDGIQREYQLKFKACFNNIPFRCMADLIIVNHNNKTVLPCDLKTSSHKEWDFYISFVQWRYMIQARLYARIIRANMDNDALFKDYTLLPYRFIVVNKETLTPLVWEYKDTFVEGDIEYNGKIYRDPVDLGEELTIYLDNQSKVPIGINLDKPNDIVEWLNKNKNEN